MLQLPYHDLAGHLRERFGCRVHKISIDAGMTCPNRDGTLAVGGCIYCNDRGSGTGQHVVRTITEQIETAKPFLRRRYGAERFVAYFQSFTNTYAPMETLRKLYEDALACDDIVGLAIGTRPDCVTDETLDLLRELNRRTYVWVEYGLQSIHDTTLRRINRGHTAEAFRDAVRRTRERDIDVCAHIILGLPGERPEDMVETARELGRMDIQGVKLHLLYVVRGTRLHEMHDRGEYRPLERNEYVAILCDMLAVLPEHMVIHRLTGDPHPGELVAPAWALEKETTLRAIRGILAERGIRQGMGAGR